LFTKTNSAVVGIYKLTSPTGRIYIGQSIDIERRWKEHSTDTYPCKLRESILKYGLVNFSKEILEECKVSELNERERFYQDFYDATNTFNLNLKLTETSDRSGYYTQELKNKLSESQKNYNKTLTVEEKLIRNKKNSDCTKGLVKTTEHILKVKKGCQKHWEAKLKSQTEREGVLLSKSMSVIRLSNKIEPSAKKVVNSVTGETFDSIKLASLNVNLTMNVLSNMLRGVTKNKTNLKYL
jgi:group I intron endonuclease